MNIALSTIILFFLLLPGIIFRRFYYSEEFSKEYFKETVFGLFISTFIPSLVIQTIWYLCARSHANLAFSYVDLSIVSDILTSSTTKATFENIEKNTFNILIYNVSMFALSGVFGYLIRQLVRLQKWDRRFKFFRFQNEWHYIISGEFFDFPRADIQLEKDKVNRIEFVFLSAIVENSGQSYLYDGAVVDYELSKTGGLATVSIANAQRRKLSDDSSIDQKGEKTDDNTNKYYPVSGHILILKYDDMKNLNFSYYTVDIEIQQDKDTDEAIFNYEPRPVE